MSERCDFYSDEEYQYALHMENLEQEKMMAQLEAEDEYNNLLCTLESVAYQIGIDHAISFLKHLRSK